MNISTHLPGFKQDELILIIDLICIYKSSVIKTVSL